MFAVIGFGRLLWKIDTALTAVVFMLGKWLESVRWICWLGKNSLPIFGIHSFILWAWIRVYCKTITHVDEEHPAVSIFTLLIIPVLAYACSALFVPFYQWGMRKLWHSKKNALK